MSPLDYVIIHVNQKGVRSFQILMVGNVKREVTNVLENDLESVHDGYISRLRAQLLTLPER